MKHPRPALPKADWLRLNELLEQALAIEPAERAAWLSALPPERPRCATCCANCWLKRVRPAPGAARRAR